MLTFAIGLIFAGGLVLYSGWTGKSIQRLLLGDNQTSSLKADGTPRAQFGQGATK